MNIYSSHCIAFRLNQEDPSCKFVQNVISKTQEYLENMEEENLKYIEKRQGSQQVAPSEIFEILRSHERLRNTKYILQYLTTFLSKLPLEKDVNIEDEIVNPFEQLKSFTLNRIDQIEEKDVYSAILRENEKLGLLTETNLWYYQGQISKIHKLLIELLKTAHKANVEDYRKLFLGLRRLSEFWFSVRNEEINRVRKSDMFIYKLTRYLLEKYS